MNDYLWDGSGEPDPEVRRLEELLSRYRSDRPLDIHEMPTLAPRGPLGGVAPALAAAAALVLALTTALFTARRPACGWEVTQLGTLAGTRQLSVGEWLETDDTSQARIKVGGIGEVEIEPRTRIRLLDAGGSSHRMALARGVMHARIWAPPRLFFVETPSATAIDLGCVYTLQVDDMGSGLLRVSVGWVELEWGDRSSVVPAGAAAATRPGHGPGTPYYEDVPLEYVAALRQVDFGSEADARALALGLVLRESRTRDALTLLHLIPRVPASERVLVYDRLAALVPPPPGVTRAGIGQGDLRMINLWWTRLPIRVPK